MSSPLQVKVARAGKEVGSYDSAEALRLLGLGTLKPTDHYWHLGMGGWELLSKLDASEGLRLRAEAEEKLNRKKAERESRARNDEQLRQRVEAEVRARLTEERAKGAPGTGVDGGTLGCIGGVLFVGGVVVVLNSFSSRDKEQRQHNGLFGYIPGTREYEKIDASGYEAVAFVAGAVALLGLGLIVAWLSRKK